MVHVPPTSSTSRQAGRIGFIGCGRLGAALARGLAGAGGGVELLATAGGASARRLSEAIPGSRAVEPAVVAAGADLVFVTVPDAQVASVAAALPWRAGQAVVHCSGAVGLEVLSPALAAGAATGCLHPLQSFPSPVGEPERFRGIVCGVEASDRALEARIEELVALLGARAVSLAGVDRARYHAAAVFASNLVVALMAAAGRCWEGAGLPREEARAALAPLLAGAASSIAERELAEALTGPVARGDIETVERHLDSLAANRDLLDLYRMLSRELLGLPLALADDRRRELEALLEVARRGAS